MANSNAKMFYDRGVDPDTRRVVDTHIQKINDYVDQVTNPQRRDFVNTSAANATAVYNQMKAEAYKALEEYRQKRLEGKKKVINNAREEIKANTRANEYNRRKYELKYKMSTDSNLFGKLEHLRGADQASSLAGAFENSSDLESYLNEVSRRDKVKKTVIPVVAEVFEKTGAEPTDVDKADLLFKLDEKRQIEGEEPGTFRVQIKDDNGEPLRRIPVKFDNLVEREKLEKKFQVKL